MIEVNVCGWMRVRVLVLVSGDLKCWWWICGCWVGGVEEMVLWC